MSYSTGWLAPFPSFVLKPSLIKLRSLPLYGWLINAAIKFKKSNNRGICNTLLVCQLMDQVRRRRRNTDWMICNVFTYKLKIMPNAMTSRMMHRNAPRIHFRFLHALMRSKNNIAKLRMYLHAASMTKWAPSGDCWRLERNRSHSWLVHCINWLLTQFVFVYLCKLPLIPSLIGSAQR